VHFQFADAFETGFIGDQAVGQAHAHITQHGGVGEIALPAGDRQLGGEVVHHRVGQPQVAFGVLEIDRIDLVRHGGGTHFAFNGSLFEVTERDVTPDVAVEVQQDGVEAHQSVEVFGDPVVRFDLCGKGIEGQSQPLDE